DLAHAAQRRHVGPRLVLAVWIVKAPRERRRAVEVGGLRNHRPRLLRESLRVVLWRMARRRAVVEEEMAVEHGLALAARAPDPLERERVVRAADAPERVVRVPHRLHAGAGIGGIDAEGQPVEAGRSAAAALDDRAALVHVEALRVLLRHGLERRIPERAG